jgi:hypothetical protein
MENIFVTLNPPLLLENELSNYFEVGGNDKSKKIDNLTSTYKDNPTLIGQT